MTKGPGADNTGALPTASDPSPCAYERNTSRAARTLLARACPRAAPTRPCAPARGDRVTSPGRPSRAPACPSVGGGRGGRRPVAPDSPTSPTLTSSLTCPPASPAAPSGAAGGAGGAALGTSTSYAASAGHKGFPEGWQPPGQPPPVLAVQLGTGDGGRSWEVVRPKRHKVDRTDPAAVQDARDDRRAENFAIRRGLRKVWRTDRVTGCGCSGARPDGEVVVRYTPASADKGPVTGFGGLLVCGNVWLCVVCSAKVAAHRSAKIERALKAAVANGGWAVLITLTVRHRLSIPLLALLRDGVQAGWRAIGKDRGVSDARKALGVIGMVRSIEITHGTAHGWHPHAHVIVVTSGRPDTAALDALGATMFRAWSAAVVRHGLPAPLLDNGGLDVSHLGSHVREGSLASLAAWAAYAAKGLAGEALFGAVKEANGRNRSIRELMRDAAIGTRWISNDGQVATTTDDTAVRLLREYEDASKAVKQITGIRELERALGLDEDTAEDEEVAGQEAGGEDVAVIAGGYWDTLVEPVAADLAAAGERYGPDGIRRWLDRNGVPWTMPTGAARTWQTIGDERERDTARILASAGTGGR